MGFEFPIEDEASRAAAPRVLIVQPKSAYLGVLARRISEGGYRVATAETVSAAIVELHRLPVDLILSELRMPQVSGLELVQMVRDDPVHRDVPIFLLTGKHDAEGAVLAYRSGADTVIAKPFHFEVLIARIGREIERSRVLARLQSDNATLDARVVGRAIELGEMRQRWLETEAELRRLQALVEPSEN
ncbi:PleD family two-component system response regulator [Sphingomonas daechungensis]|uniref:PleD family two-component system response regulator n=1 Tax=Sphingomonas daechungensis TaxID=1176646 RepID=UPI003784B164